MNFSASGHPNPLLATCNVLRHVVFHSYFSDDNKQDSTTTSAHRKQITELLQNRQLLFVDIIKIWGNTDGCAEQYQCETALYLISILTHAYIIIINHSVGASVHVRKVVDGLNATYNRFFSC